jgi:hypothetical protein
MSFCRMRAPRCKWHGKPMSPPKKTRSGDWQACRNGDGEWRELVCPEEGCWAYFVQRRSAKPARRAA